MMKFGDNNFAVSFSDPQNHTNRIVATDLGANEYLNFYIRMYLDSRHAPFAGSVIMEPEKFASSTDMTWPRFQVFF